MRSPQFRLGRPTWHTFEVEACEPDAATAGTSEEAAAVNGIYEFEITDDDLHAGGIDDPELLATTTARSPGRSMTVNGSSTKLVPTPNRTSPTTEPTA